MKHPQLISVLIAGTMFAAPPSKSENKEQPKQTIVVAQKESFAKDLALAGWRSTGEDFIIIIVNLRTRELTRLKNHDPAPNGMKVKAAHLADTRKDAHIELELNGEAAKIRYDETWLKQKAAKPAKLIQTLPDDGSTPLKHVR